MTIKNSGRFIKYLLYLLRKFVNKSLDLLLVAFLLLGIIYCEYKFHYTPFDVVKLMLAIFFIFIFIKALISYPFKILKCKFLMNKLEDVRNEMINLASTKRMYEKFGVDLIQLEVSTQLVTPIADPDAGGLLLPKIIALRERMTDKLGFVIPNIRILDRTDIKDYEYRIIFREIFVDNGFVYPNHLMVKKLDLENLNIELPKNYIEFANAINPIEKDEVYWLKEKDIEKQNVNKLNAVDVIIKHIERLSIEYSDELMTHSDVTQLINIVKKTNPELTENLCLELLSLADLKKIFTNLIKERISIKDILYIFECLNDFARFSKKPDELSEKVRFALRRQIQQRFLSENKIYALTFTDEAKEKLTNDAKNIDFNGISKIIKDIIKDIDGHIKPVLLVSQNLRLNLYRSLSKFIPTINIVSYDELENINTQIIKEISF